MSDPFHPITCREKVAGLPPYLVPTLAALASGNSYKQIAYELHMPEATVRNYVERIYSRLGVNSAVQATRMAVMAGVV
jgi:DNA-binding NarL/FixJ family response regulator